jgi:hypothetical protein
MLPDLDIGDHPRGRIKSPRVLHRPQFYNLRIGGDARTCPNKVINAAQAGTMWRKIVNVISLELLNLPVGPFILVQVALPNLKVFPGGFHSHKILPTICISKSMHPTKKPLQEFTRKGLIFNCSSRSFFSNTLWAEVLVLENLTEFDTSFEILNPVRKIPRSE